MFEFAVHAHVTVPGDEPWRVIKSLSYAEALRTLDEQGVRVIGIYSRIGKPAAMAVVGQKRKASGKVAEKPVKRTELAPKGKTARELKAAAKRKDSGTVAAAEFKAPATVTELSSRKAEKIAADVDNELTAEMLETQYVGKEVKIGFKGDKWWLVHSVTDAGELHIQRGDDEKTIAAKQVKASRKASAKLVSAK